MNKLIVVLFFTAILSACGGSSSSDNSPNPGTNPNPFTQLRNIIDQDLANNDAAAVSIAIYKEGEIVFAEAFGEKVKGEGESVTPNTLFQLGSTTKMFTGVATLQLVQQGSLSLDDKLVNVFPQIQYPGEQALDWQDIAIEHLLTHQSGLRDSAMQDEGDLVNHMQTNYPNEFLQMNPPGFFHNYSNPNWSYLGAIVENQTQQSFEEYVKQNIFDELGMTRSFVGREGAVADGDYALGFQLLDPEQGGSFNTQISQIPMTTVGHPAGTETWSTPTEQLKMAEFLLNGDSDILDNSLRTQLTTAHVSEDFAGLPINYGYGIYVNDGFRVEDNWYPIKNWNHGGNTFSYTSIFYVFPEIDVAISIMSSGAFNNFDSTLVAALGAVSTLPSPQDLPVIQNDPAQYDKHEGTYSGSNFTFIVNKVGDNLLITIPELDENNVPYERELEHFGDDTFFANIGGEVSDLTFIQVEEGGESVFIRNRELVAIKDGF